HSKVAACLTAHWPSRIRTTPMCSKGMTRRTLLATRPNTSWSSSVSAAISAMSESTRATDSASSVASWTGRPMIVVGCSIHLFVEGERPFSTRLYKAMTFRLSWRRGDGPLSIFDEAGRLGMSEAESRHTRFHEEERHEVPVPDLRGREAVAEHAEARGREG